MVSHTQNTDFVQVLNEEEMKTLTIADLEQDQGALKPLKNKGQWFEGEY